VSSKLSPERSQGCYPKGWQVAKAIAGESFFMFKSLLFWLISWLISIIVFVCLILYSGNSQGFLTIEFATTVVVVIFGILSFIKFILKIEKAIKIKHSRIIGGFFSILAFIFSLGIGIGVLAFALYILPKPDNNSQPNNNVHCNRKEPYLNPPEFERARSLRVQRLEESGLSVDKSFYNCIDIQYADLKNTNKAEGVFLFDPNSNIEDMKIYVDNSYHSYDDLLTAILLSHEMTHVSQFVNYKKTSIKQDCYKSEIAAFYSEIVFFSRLNHEEKRSIASRLAIYPDSNSAYTGFTTLLDYYNKAIRDCNDKNPCTADTVGSLITNMVKESSFYKNQCSSVN